MKFSAHILINPRSLIWDSVNLNLDVVTTNNEDIPPATQTPILALDFFEHAYFLDYEQASANYLGNLTAIYNWKWISTAFEAVCNQTWPSGSKASLKGTAADLDVESASSSSGPSTGVIVAAVIGGLAAAGLAAAGAVIFIRRRNSKGRYATVGRPSGFPIVNAEETHQFVRNAYGDEEKTVVETVEYRDPYSDHQH